MLHHDLERGAATEGQVAGEHLVQNDAEGVDVRAVIDVRVSVGLLGRQVLRRSHHQAGRGQPGRVRLAQRRQELADAEVEQLDDLLIVLLDQEDIGRLEIPVDNALGVGGRDGLQHLTCDLAATPRLHRAVAGEDGPQISAAKPLHHDERASVVDDAVVGDSDDIGVPDSRRRHRLAVEPGDLLLVPGEVFAQDLDRHLLAQPQVLGEVDHAHPAAADLLRNTVSLAEDAADQRVHLGVGARRPALACRRARQAVTGGRSPRPTGDRERCGPHGPRC